MRAFSGKVRRRFAVSSLRCPILSELSEEVGQLKADKRWRDNLQRFQESQDFTPGSPLNSTGRIVRLSIGRLSLVS
ncbi:MAG UNVERIFIED_CONTAM: hypothetical protein LVR29_09845 [Microcystis novacekii LVE1205-3]